MTDSNEPGSQPEPQQPAPGQPPLPGYGQPPLPAYVPPPGYGQQPPGYGPPGYGPPGYGQPPYSYAGRGHGQPWPAASSPGGIPLRPLALGDLYSGAVGSARRNPMATFGLAAILMTISGVLSTTARLVIGSEQSHLVAGGQGGSASGAAVILDVVVLLIGLLLQFTLTGMLTGVIGRGVLGRKVSLGEAWRTGRTGAVIGTAFLFLLLGIAVFVPAALFILVILALTFAHSGPAGAVLAVLCFLGSVVAIIVIGIRLCLTMPAVVLERLGPLRAFARSWQLTRGSFWRLFGIKLLTYIVIFIATLIIEIPFGLAGGGLLSAASISRLASESIVFVIATAVGGIAANTLMEPFKCGVTVLLYVDMRMRREGLDLVLYNASQQGALTGEEFETIWRPPPREPAGQWQQYGQWPGPAQSPGQWPAQGPPAVP